MRFGLTIAILLDKLRERNKVLAFSKRRNGMANINPVDQTRWPRRLATLLGFIAFFTSSLGFAASEVGGKPEKPEIIVTYGQASGAWTHV